MANYGRPSAPTQPPQQAMPSRRVSVPNQIKLLVVAAALGGPRLKAFSIHDAAQQSGIAIGQIRYSTRFLVEAGLWDAIGSGVYAPSQAGRDFGTQWESARERARAVLAACFSTMWFMPTLQRDLADGPVPIEKLEAALLADGGGHQQHIKLLRSLLEWLTVAKLVEQHPDGSIAAGELLVLQTSSEAYPDTGADADAEVDRHGSGPDGASVGVFEEELAMGAPLDELTFAGETVSVPQARATSVLTQLIVEALQLLDPGEIPDFMRTLATLAQANGESVLHRC